MFGEILPIATISLAYTNLAGEYIGRRITCAAYPTLRKPVPPSRTVRD